MGCATSQLDLAVRPYSNLFLVGQSLLYLDSGLLVQKQFDMLPSFSAVSLVNQREIYVSGGITALGKASGLIFQGNISPGLTRINLSALRKQQMPFQTLEPMSIPRYAHASISLNNHLYVLGGRTYEQQILTDCECYDFQKNVWLQIRKLNFPRVSLCALLFRHRIYVFGGYSGNDVRTRKIQRYIQQKNVWQILPFKIPMGVQAPLLMPGTLGTFLLIGGNTHSGPSKAVYLINLVDETVIARPNLIKARFMAKGFVKDSKMLIFGGCQDNSVQVHSLFQQANPELSEEPIFSSISPVQLRTYSQALYPLIVREQEENMPQQEFQSIRKQDSGCVIFGTDLQPFILSLNFSTGVGHRRPVSLRFQLKSFMSAISLGSKILICGGVNFPLTKVSSKSYIYDPESDQFKKTQSMLTPRYGHSLVHYGSLVYAVGGKGKGEDAILSSVQCFQMGNWMETGHMRKRRSSPGVLETNQGFIVFGGYSGNGTRSNEIEVFSVKRGFIEVEAKIALPMQGCGVVHHKQIFLFGGRVQDGDSQQVWKVQHNNFQEPIERTFKWNMSHAGKLSRCRALPKLFFNGKTEVFIFGIPNKSIEVYSLKHCSLIKRKNTDLQGMLEGFQRQLIHLQDGLLKSYTLGSVGVQRKIS